jgi:hypothetical protein
MSAEGTSGWLRNETDGAVALQLNLVPPAGIEPTQPTQEAGRFALTVSITNGCTTGKACGDGCISKNDACHQPPACACNAY